LVIGFRVMRNEILINTTSREVRVALVDNGVLQEVMIERASHRGIVGNIYKGKVVRVLPGMQAAFIDIGLDRTAFLHASDICNSGQVAEDERNPVPTEINRLLREGQEVVVQVAKDPLGSKGARLTTNITIPSRYLVLLPADGKIGISSRIEDEDERQRLRALMEDVCPEGSGYGYIVRTAAEGADAEALRADAEFLNRLWKVIEQDSITAQATHLVHEDLTLTVRIVRDVVNSDIDHILVDSDQALEGLRKFAERFMPEMLSSIELYTGRRPLLDLYGVEDEIEKALNRKVSLKSGGYLIFDQTEAMTTIDVNTGAFVGRRNLEDTIFRTNLEAAVAIARQLRIRNLGGIIIIDFIDMDEEGHRSQVLDALETSLGDDHARTQIHVHSSLGLVEMTRKRTRESLEHIMCSVCPTCEGNGFIKIPETVCYEIFREILRQHRQFKFDELVVLAHEDVVELLLDEEASGLAELEELTGRPIRLQTESICTQDRFDVVLM
jgi:ribonuclease G